MNIVTTTSVYPEGYPAEEALKRLAAVGFKCLDMAFDFCVTPGHPFTGDNWREWALNLRAMADELGVRYTHGHSCGMAESRNIESLRCFEACEILGIRYLVVHPRDRTPDDGYYKTEEFIRMNVESYRGLLPYAEKRCIGGSKQRQ